MQSVRRRSHLKTRSFPETDSARRVLEYLSSNTDRYMYRLPYDRGQPAQVQIAECYRDVAAYDRRIAGMGQENQQIEARIAFVGPEINRLRDIDIQAFDETLSNFLSEWSDLHVRKYIVDQRLKSCKNGLARALAHVDALSEHL